MQKSSANPFVNLDWNNRNCKGYERSNKDITNCNRVHMEGMLERSKQRKTLHCDGNSNACPEWSMPDL